MQDKYQFRWNIIFTAIIIIYGLFEAIISISEGRMIRTALAIALSLTGLAYFIKTVNNYN